MNKPRINIIAAVGTNGVIGGGNEMLWRIPEDEVKKFLAKHENQKAK